VRQRRRRRSRLAPAWLAFCLCLLAPGTGLAKERLEAAYELRWRGLEIARFEVTLAADEAAYRVAYAARTTGFIAWLFPFTSAGASVGDMAGPGLRPERYAGRSIRRDGTSTWSVEFGPEGDARRVEVKVPEDEERDPVPKALRVAPDPLALALEATGAAAPGIRFAGMSFDGKRAVRFELVCEPAERALAPDEAALAIDSALGCTLDGEVAAGASRRWQSGRDAARRPAQVLLSREIVAGRYWPVRVEAQTRFGAVVARLTRHR
jgi:Protein of unknown function (DUF3108)